jgi:FkbM family methyltransferase
VDSSGEGRVIADLPSQEPVIFDVGANIGQYCVMVKSISPRARIFSFEPAQAARTRLKERVREFDGVTVLDYGLGESEQHLELFLDQPCATTASAYKEGLAAIGTAPTFSESVHVRRLDHVVQELGVQHIDLLKIDVEGHELAVLKGAGQKLRDGSISAVQFEFGPFSVYSRTHLRDFFEILSGYEIYRITEHALLSCGEWTPIQEIPITTNYYAKWR